VADTVGVTFMNGIGNFILFTAVIKILRHRRVNITLITDERFLSNEALLELSEGIFDDIVYDFEPDKFDVVYVFPWCIPKSVQMKSELVDLEKTTTLWYASGIHEVQMYLEGIGATWKDYEGFILTPIYVELPKTDKIKIVLSNCSGTEMAKKKSWENFPELSQILLDLGYDIYLIGIGDELENCAGHNFVNKLSIRETASVIEQCDLMIATSTGNVHIADAVNTPILLIEGPILTTKNHPLNVNYDIVRTYISCAPCFQKAIWNICKHKTCMKDIIPAGVVQRMLSFIPKMNQSISRFKFVKGFV